MISQLSLPALGIGAIPNPAGLFWCCGDCLPVTNGRYSLIWQPPNQQVGECVHCGQRYEFGSRYGEAELVAAQNAMNAHKCKS